MKCRKCKETIPDEAVDQGRGVVTCPGCNLLQLAGESGFSKTHMPFMPAGITMTKDEDRLALSFRPWSWLYLIPLLAAGALMGVLYQPILAEEQVLRMALVFCAAVMTYFGFAGMINRTHVVADTHFLRVTHKPLPSIPIHMIPVHKIKQIFVVQNGMKHEESGDTSYYYRVRAELKATGRVDLTPALKSCDQALYIEQELERFLGIEDVPVSGELGNEYS